MCSIGIILDVLILCCDCDVFEVLKNKIVLMCDVDIDGVIFILDVLFIYDIFKVLYCEEFDVFVVC